MRSYWVAFAGISLLTLAACGGGSGGSSSPPPPAVHNEWTWSGGANIVNQLGSYGAQGIVSLSNSPGGRAYSSTWTDAAGNFWLFGGYGLASTGAGVTGHLNDLWKYRNGEWTWMNGSNQTEQPGSYGTQGVAAPGNTPGGRYGSASWTDSSGNLWLFGGIGWGSAGTLGDLNDLWRYSNGEWTWMSGSNFAAEPGITGAWQGTGIYGTKGIANPANVPGARNWASTWIDNSGNLWLFGGSGIDSNGEPGILDDLWEYSGGEWTWVGGSNLADNAGFEQDGQYGALGIPGPANIPGARFGAATWTDAEGNFWLFGGDGDAVSDAHCNETGSPCNLSDLWRYSSGEWTWMGGPDQANEPGIYGTQGVAATGNNPAPRNGALTWVDTAGNVWLFGGTGHDDFNDLWKYSGGEWTWMSGSNQSGQTGTYGTLGTAAPGNVPGCRDGAVGWTDKSGNLWLFGGEETYCVGNGKFNDLWEYQP